MTKQERIKLCKDYLTEEGYRPSIDETGDLFFKFEGRTHFILIDDKDDEFFQIAFLNFWRIEDNDELVRAFKAANEASRDTKVVKVVVREDGKNVIASVEMFITSPEDFSRSLKRSLSAIRYAADHFADAMRTTQTQAA